MGGFEGPRESGSDGAGTPKLPSWAVTRKGGASPARRPPAVEPPSGVADLGPPVDAPRPPKADPPVVRVPEHPFDVDDPFGDNQLGGATSPWIRPPADDSEVRVVDLADEFHLTTQQALEVCAASGTPATSGAAWLTADQAEAFRAAVATYDRSEPVEEPYPAWAVPPGGRRGLPTGPGMDTVVPGATLLASRPRVVDDEDEPSGGTFRVVLLVVALLVIAALVALQFLR